MPKVRFIATALIVASRLVAAFNVSWGVALASWHPDATAEDEANIIAAQKKVIYGEPLVFRGPSTGESHNLGYLADTVHFNKLGLDNHALGQKDSLSEIITVESV